MPGCTHCHSEPHAHQPPPDPGFRKVLWIALWANLAMFVLEVGASIRSGSVALMADSIDFAGDAANYALSLFVLGMALQVRAKAALFKGLCMGAYGVGILGFAMYSAIQGDVPHPHTMGVVALLALSVNVGVAAMQYAYRNGDSNMRSVWLCSRNDAIGNLAVLGAALLVGVTNTAWPDLAVACLMATLGLTASWTVVRQARGELALAHAHPHGTEGAS